MSDDKRTHGGLSVKTLLIAGAASAAAAIVIPMLWRPGTVFAAAMTPIVVALVSELLRRPVETVSSVRVRRTPRGTAILEPPPEEPFDPLAPPSAEDLAILPETPAPPPRRAPAPPADGAAVEARAGDRARRVRERRRRVHRLRAGRRRRRLGRRLAHHVLRRLQERARPTRSRSATNGSASSPPRRPRRRRPRSRRRPPRRRRRRRPLATPVPTATPEPAEPAPAP